MRWSWFFPSKGVDIINKVLYIIKHPEGRIIIRFRETSHKGETCMSEQISDIRGNSREESVRSAMEDIALIRRMINHTEINMHRLGWLFLVYGLVCLAYTLFETFSTLIVAHTSTLQTTGNVSFILSLLTYVVIAVLFMLFLRKRAAIVKTESEHTMKLFDLWGVMMFAPTALELIISLAAVITAGSMPEISVALLHIVFSVIRNTALYMCIFFTGQYTGSRFLKIASAVLIILLIALFTCGISPEGTGTWMSESNYFMQLNGIAGIRIKIASFVQILVYLGMGIYCIVKQRGSVHGDE